MHGIDSLVDDEKLAHCVELRHHGAAGLVAGGRPGHQVEVCAIGALCSCRGVRRHSQMPLAVIDHLVSMIRLAQPV